MFRLVRLFGRPKSAKAPAASDNVLDNLRRRVECPICMGLPRDGKVFQCENGHVICGRCLDSLQSRVCPSGRCAYATPAARNRPIEDIIKEHEFSYKCARSEGGGCTFEGPKEAVEDHEKRTCPLRTFRCPYDGKCGEEVAIRDFSRHMEEAHGEWVIHVQGNSFRNGFVMKKEMPDSTAPASCLFAIHNLDNKGTFVPYLHLEAGHFHLWVYSVGDQDVTGKFRVEIKLSGEGCDLRWVGRTFPIETPKEVIMEDKECLNAGCNVLERFTFKSEEGTSRALNMSVRVQSKRRWETEVQAKLGRLLR